MPPAASVVAVRGRPRKRQPLASSATAVSTMNEIAQRIGSGATCVSTRLPIGAPTMAADQEQADAPPVDVFQRPRQQRQDDDDLEQQAERDADGRPVKRRKSRRHHHRRTETREAAHHAGENGDDGAIRKETARKSGMRKARQASIASARSDHHIMQAMPSKNLAVSTVPLHMPYIQRRPKTTSAASRSSWCRTTRRPATSPRRSAS